MQIEITQELALFLTLFNLGFFGGFLHCSSMCSPFVIHQVSSRLALQDIESYSGLAKFKNIALLPYHFGRVTTYSFVGSACSYFAQNLRQLEKFNILSGSLLIFAGLLMVFMVFNRKIVKFSIISIIFSKFPKFAFFKKIMSFLFSNPTSYRGFILGVILGFLPCGLLYSAFVIAATIVNPINAFIAIFIFGISTFPALFLVALVGHSLLNYAKNYLKIIARLVILINSVTIVIMGLNLM